MDNIIYCLKTIEIEKKWKEKEMERKEIFLQIQPRMQENWFIF